MLMIRKDVDVKGVRPEIVLALTVIQSLIGDRSAEVTSIVRQHGSKSIHPYGLAVDFVIPILTHEEKIAFLDKFENHLGPQYDVLLHDSGSGLHFHVEYDPR